MNSPIFIWNVCRSGLFLTSLFLLSWLMMQVIHESGHVLGAWLTGGTVVQVDLHPLRISQTIVRPNPHPQFEIWAGPVFGSLFPLFVWYLVRRRCRDREPLLRFFTGFCLIANGAYLGSAVIMPIGDAFELHQTGTPIWLLGIFGFLSLPLGVWLWDGLSSPLGIGKAAEPVPGKQIGIIIGLLVMTIAIELWWSG